MSTETLAAAHAAVSALLKIVMGDGKRAPGLMGRRVDGTPHLRDCRVGQWVDGYSGGAGAPCSARCQEARAALVLAERFAELLVSDLEADGLPDARPAEPRLLEAS